MASNNSDYQIRQDGNVILSGDEISIKMIFRNLTGENFKDTMSEYSNYKKFAKSQGFDLSKIFHLYHGDTYIKTGNFYTIRS